jgi:hypothetical protein
LAILTKIGLPLPNAYFPQKSGSPYKHANCIGCIKAPAKYWAKIRVDYPLQFRKMAQLERETKQCVVKYKGEWTPLDELPLDIEDEGAEYDFECSILCDLFVGKET